MWRVLCEFFLKLNGTQWLNSSLSQLLFSSFIFPFSLQHKTKHNCADDERERGWGSRVVMAEGTFFSWLPAAAAHHLSLILVLRSCCAFLGPSGGLSRRDGREGRRQKAHSTGGEGSLAIGSPRSSSSNHRFVSGPRSPLRLRQWTHRSSICEEMQACCRVGIWVGAPRAVLSCRPVWISLFLVRKIRPFWPDLGNHLISKFFLSFFVLTAQFPNSAPLLHCFWSVHFSPPGNASCSWILVRVCLIFERQRLVFPVAPFRHEGGSSAPMDQLGARLNAGFPLWSLVCVPPLRAPYFTRNHWRAHRPRISTWKKNALGMTEPGNSIFDTKRFCLSSFYAVLDIWHVL